MVTRYGQLPLKTRFTVLSEKKVNPSTNQLCWLEFAKILNDVSIVVAQEGYTDCKIGCERQFDLETSVIIIEH